MRGLSEKGVLVTGGSSGIGRATVARFLEEGSRVFFCGLDAAQVDAVASELSVMGTVTGRACDVSLEREVTALVDEAETVLGGVDVLINNAGIARKDRFLDIAAGDWDRVLNVNLRGMFLVAQAIARRMVERGGGVIVNMASTNALGGEEEFAHYNASKGGVLQLTRTMAPVPSLSSALVQTPVGGDVSVMLTDRLALVEPATAGRLTARVASSHRTFLSNKPLGVLELLRN